VDAYKTDISPLILAYCWKGCSDILIVRSILAYGLHGTSFNMGLSESILLYGVIRR
jgi:hypothetical protein